MKLNLNEFDVMKAQAEFLLRENTQLTSRLAQAHATLACLATKLEEIPEPANESVPS